MDKQPEAQAGAADHAVSPTHGADRERVALTQGLGGILGIKAGMTQVFNDKGDALAVTVIDLKPSIISQLKTKEKDGYQAVQVGFLSKKPKSVNGPEKGHAKASGSDGFYHYQEIRLPEGAALDGLTVGKVLSPEFVKEGDLIDLTAICKGKGFQGVMKRHHFAGGMASHGASVCHRMPGSIGNRADPAKVFKNKKMAGQMGNLKKTIQNVRVVKVDVENQLLLVHGSVPGPTSGIVTIRKAVKNAG